VALFASQRGCAECRKASSEKAAGSAAMPSFQRHSGSAEIQSADHVVER